MPLRRLILHFELSDTLLEKKRCVLFLEDNCLLSYHLIDSEPCFVFGLQVVFIDVIFLEVAFDLFDDVVCVALIDA